MLVPLLLRLTRSKLKRQQKLRKTNSPIHLDYRENKRYKFPISILNLKVWVLKTIARKKKKILSATAKAKKKRKKLRVAQMNPSIKSNNQFIPSSTITINVQRLLMQSKKDFESISYLKLNHLEFQTQISKSD